MLIRLKNLFLIKTTPPIIPLGRWNIVYCEKKINKKLDLSNEDHCGSCNQYNNYIKNNKKEKKIKINEIIFYEHM
jgi:hypothetical protein